MRLTYHPEAEAELVQSAAFYEKRSSGLGERFLRAFEAAIVEIQTNPHRWTVIEDQIRCYAMKRFPFGIYFRIRSDDLHILVVKHHSRHPDYWRDRLEN